MVLEISSLQVPQLIYHIVIYLKLNESLLWINMAIYSPDNLSLFSPMIASFLTYKRYFPFFQDVRKLVRFYRFVKNISVFRENIAFCFQISTGIFPKTTDLFQI